MTTVFLSGSRRIRHLNDAIRDRLRRIIDQDFRIIVGDANGADKALQGYLAEQRYAQVEVYFSGNECRNNVGSWRMRGIYVDPALKGRAFYTAKDREMAAKADFGFVLWDGRSAGSINNVCELVKRGKKAVVYFAPEKRFANVTRITDIDALLGKCSPDDVRAIQKTVNGVTPGDNHESSPQGVLL